VFVPANSRRYKASGSSEIISARESHGFVPWNMNSTASDLLEKADVSLFESEPKEEFLKVGSLEEGALPRDNV
jgi:hypothetical protein